ncbi:hypothetical protein PHMEG_00022580 [Phytophthora megakarya]|uniref:Retrotransposon gag domain-containing protein n=1 Tax=Phytophthora megakarya TaxID=4795 RepID=A0A225VJ10_9STRA|nr:hypothetical protein PHMEG_00022580 [Phytophthora megakarya]
MALAKMAEVMAQQQHEIWQLLEHQQQVLDKLKPVGSGERRAEGISMPTYNGKIGESLQLYVSAKNITVDAADNHNRLVAMVASNLKGQAAPWYTFNQGKFGTLNALAEALQSEFVPPDLQERLRAELFQLKQIHYKDLEGYVAKFRQIICQVRDMSNIDQITWFVHGLVTRTREEVSYRRCTTVSKAITVAVHTLKDAEIVEALDQDVMKAKWRLLFPWNEEF